MELTTTEAFVLAIGAMGLGIVMLIRGGNWTVDSAVYIAVKFGISPMVVGFTIVAVGTSLPELVVSVLANLQGSGGIAIGNVLGSNIANVLLVIGATALFVPLITQARKVIKDLLVMMISTALILYLLLQGDINQLAGLGMVSLLIAYIFYQYRNSLKEESAGDMEELPEFRKAYEPYLFLLLGLGGIALGAEFLVRGASVSAGVLGVPEAVIALSIIAFGTSLPELSTCIIAAKKGHSDIAIGNIIGSNVFNILMILGVTAIVSPILENSYARQLVDFDMWVMAAISLVFALLLVFYNKITKPIGIVFLTSYVAYNIYIYVLYLYDF